MRGLVLTFLLATVIALLALRRLRQISECAPKPLSPKPHLPERSRNVPVAWFALCYGTADERNASFKRRVVYDGRVYFCKR